VTCSSQGDGHARHADEGRDPEAEHPAQKLAAHLLNLGTHLLESRAQLDLQLAPKLGQPLLELRVEGAKGPMPARDGLSLRSR
jgi:hypothetical protein